MSSDNIPQVLAALEALADLPVDEREAEARRRLADQPEVLEEVLASLPYLKVDVDETDFLGPQDFRWDLDHSGMQLDHYLLGDLVGVGGVGIVYRAHDSKLDREVAVKVLHPSFAISPVAQERFSREFRSAAALQHENIVRVYDSGEAQNLQYCVMELVHGSASLRGQRFSQDQTAKIISAVCRGLAHSHAAGVVHRDIKPGNILLTPDGTPKIADFGLAHDDRFAVDRLTRTGELAGTLYYMSPEQVARRKQPITSLTDVYSVGAVFYELLTQRPPHHGQTSIHIFEQIRDEIPRAIDRSISVELATICYKALRKSPADRYQSAAEMADDLDRFLRGEPILARPESLAKRAWRLAKRPKVRNSIVAALLLGCIAWGTSESLAASHAQATERTLRAQNSEQNQEIIKKLINMLPDDYNPTGDPRFPAEDPNKQQPGPDENED